MINIVLFVLRKQIGMPRRRNNLLYFTRLHFSYFIRNIIRNNIYVNIISFIINISITASNIISFIDNFRSFIGQHNIPFSCFSFHL